MEGNADITTVGPTTVVPFEATAMSPIIVAALVNGDSMPAAPQVPATRAPFSRPPVRGGVEVRRSATGDAFDIPANTVPILPPTSLLASSPPRAIGPALLIATKPWGGRV